MLELFIYITGVILVLILGIIFIVFYKDCDIEDASLIVAGASILSWIAIIFVVTGLIIVGLYLLVYNLTTHIKTKKGL